MSVLHQSLVHLMDCHYIMLCILEVEMSMLLDLVKRYSATTAVHLAGPRLEECSIRAVLTMGPLDDLLPGTLSRYIWSFVERNL